MPEHVHLLVSEPESAPLATALQALKQSVARRLALRAAEPFWQARYYDFNVWTDEKRVEKLRSCIAIRLREALSLTPETGLGQASGITRPVSRAQWRLNRIGPCGNGTRWVCDQSCEWGQSSSSRPSKARTGHPQGLVGPPARPIEICGFPPLRQKTSQGLGTRLLSVPLYAVQQDQSAEQED
jgi:hypothetical protein